MSGRSDITHEDVMRIFQIVDQSEDVEIIVEYDGLKLHVAKGAAASLPVAGASAQPVAAPAQSREAVSLPSPVSAASAAPADGTSSGDAIPAGALTITAPLLGRFYRASSPTEPAFVEIGSRIGEGDTVGVVEVMKLFNEIKSGLSGTIVEIRAANEEMVEEGQILFIVQPD